MTAAALPAEAAVKAEEERLAAEAAAKAEEERLAAEAAPPATSTTQAADPPQPSQIEWTAYVDPHYGATYFYNSITGQTTWDPPPDYMY